MDFIIHDFRYLQRSKNGYVMITRPHLYSTRAVIFNGVVIEIGMKRQS